MRDFNMYMVTSVETDVQHVRDGIKRERALGRHVDSVSVLASFHYWGGSLRKVHRYFDGLDVKVDLFADSGGFSAMTVGATVRLADYAKWVHANREMIGVFMNLDVIGDPIKTQRNQEVLEREGLAPLPIFHVGSDFKYLDAMAERYEYFAFGGMVPYMAKQRSWLRGWIASAFRRLHSRGRHPKVHGLGLGTSWQTVLGFPWRSCDSSGWSSGKRFGHMALYDEKRDRWRGVSIRRDYAGAERRREMFRGGDLLRSYGLSASQMSKPVHYMVAAPACAQAVLRAEQRMRRGT